MEIYQSLMNDYKAGTLKYVSLKENVANALVELSNKFSVRKAELLANPGAIEEQVHAMTGKARSIAKETLKEVRELVGLPPRND
jgi:tryptophanyl-tRNA synthetase